MDSRVTLLSITILSLVAGCATHSEYKRTVQDEIDWANEQIDGQRIVKRRLLAADPMERSIESRLRRDPRLEAARFAIVIPGFGGCGVSEDAPFHFEAVLSFRSPATQSEAEKVLRDAMKPTGTRCSLTTWNIAPDGLTAAASGLVVKVENENADLSNLPRH